ncbi:MAG: hypothetical protein KC912_14320 [Proteobacteria bacterium]|nr:hypothetical protein [Pseudomonadota bacterium]
MSHCKLPFLLIAITVASPAIAGEAHLGANTVATGGASAALTRENAAVTASPGTLALTERYDGMGFGSLGPGLDYRAGASAVDSRTGPVAFGLAYRRSHNNLPVTDQDQPGWLVDGAQATNKEQSHDVTIALAVPISDRMFSVGVNGTLLWWKRERRGKGFSGNLDVGFAAAPSKYFTASLTGRNLIYIIEDEDMPVGGVLGLRAGDREIFHGVADIEYSVPYGLSVRTGVDGSAGPTRLRGGYAWDAELSQHHVTWGLGMENTAGAFEYAMRIPVTNNNHGFAGILHTISFRVYPPPLEPPAPR